MHDSVPFLEISTQKHFVETFKKVEEIFFLHFWNLKNREIQRLVY